MEASWLCPTTIPAGWKGPGSAFPLWRKTTAIQTCILDASSFDELPEITRNYPAVQAWKKKREKKKDSDTSSFWKYEKNLLRFGETLVKF